MSSAAILSFFSAAKWVPHGWRAYAKREWPDVKRREFITLLGGAAVARPVAARSQQPTKLPIIGFLGAGTLSSWSHRVASFVQRLRELGWIEGRTIAIEYRWAEGSTERLPDVAAEFVRLKKSSCILMV